MTRSTRTAAPATSRYLAECFWPGVREPDVEAAAARLARGVASGGSDPELACEGWILAAGDEVVFFLFRATSGESVRRVCEQAAIGAERVIEVRATVAGGR